VVRAQLHGRDRYGDMSAHTIFGAATTLRTQIHDHFSPEALVRPTILVWAHLFARTKINACFHERYWCEDLCSHHSGARNCGASACLRTKINACFHEKYWCDGITTRDRWKPAHFLWCDRWKPAHISQLTASLSHHVPPGMTSN
jgi:hypothetical protein